MATIRSHYEIGGINVLHKGQVTNTIVGSTEADLFLDSIEDNIYAFKAGFIPPYHKGRPDLISNLFLGTPEKWWLVLLINNIDDPFEGLKIGTRILVPK